MGFFSIFKGKSPEAIERAGDRYQASGEFGLAVLQYEKAMEKLLRQFPGQESYRRALGEKIIQARNALARRHLENGEELLSSGLVAEARDLLRLALELTDQDEIRRDIEASLQRCETRRPKTTPAETAVAPLPAAVPPEGDGDYFTILCHALPEPVCQAYQGYGPAFRKGFVALNNGDFQTAAKKLAEAWEEDPQGRPLAALELATALMNLGRMERAAGMVSDFIRDYPDELRGYQILCDIYWATGELEAAARLIEEAPKALQDTFPLKVLLGETFYQMGRHEDAQAVFLSCRNRFGRSEMISRSLAKTFEAMGDLEQAKIIYSGILNGCARCGARTDPFVKYRYAELCFATGERSARLLELYLSVVHEDPDSRDACYRRIADIHEALGNTEEAARYR